MKHAQAPIIAAFIAVTLNAADATVVYDSIPSFIPPNVDSLVFSDASATEFGDAIRLAGAGRVLTSVAVLMSSGAVRSDYAGSGTAAGYAAPLTLTLYNVGSAGPDPTVGSAFASRTIGALLPWRPAASPACNNGDYQAIGGFCYSAVASVVTFDFTGVTVPNSFIFGLSFNTSDAGRTPTNAAGPIDQLGVGFARTITGTDLDPDGVEWNTANADYRTIGDTNVFGPDTGWSDSGTPAVRFVVADTATPIPEPGTLSLLVAAIPAVLRRRRPRT